ncbi:MAG: hypothetical protein ACOX61_07110 [Brooklawnia sp.]
MARRAHLRVSPGSRTGATCSPLLPDFLAGSKVIVRPVIDPTTIGPVSGYEVPDRMRS